MAQCYAGVQGQRGQATRLGNKKTGIAAFINGWSGGVRVVGRWDEELQKDVFEIRATKGSGYGEADGYIGKVIDGKFYPKEETKS